MINSKIRTLLKVHKVFGFTQLFRIFIEKFSFSKKSDIDFPDSILWQSLNLESEKLEFEAFLPGSRVSVERNGFFSEIYDLGSELGSFLIKYIRQNSPEQIVETGVAAGRSTALILAELSKYQNGILDSFDVTDNVGELVSSDLKVHWNLHVLPKIFRKKSFVSQLQNLSKAQLFLHDSDHKPGWQLFEISQVLNHLTSLHYLLVDDIQPEVASWLIEQFDSERLIFLNESGRKKSLILDCR